MNKTITKATVSVLLALVCLALSASSAQAVQIRAETGDALPSSIIVNEDLTVLITDDEGNFINGTAESARVRYILPADDGTPIPVGVGSDGKTVNPYKPPMIGVLNITVSYGTTLMASQTVNVIEAAMQTLDRVEISPDSADWMMDDIEPFTATCYATDATGGGTISDCTLTWTCDSPAVGTINSSGLFTASGVGTATVTVSATYGGVTKTDAAVVNVSAPTETVHVTGDNFSEEIDAGTAADVTVNGTFENSITGSIDITPVADPEETVGSYAFTVDAEALIGLTVTPNATIAAELADDNGTIRIEICYNATELASKGISLSTLAIWRYNTTTSQWVKMVADTPPCVANGRDDNCVWIEVNNLSTFALVGTKTKITPSGGGSGGSGTYPPGWLGTPTVTATKAPAATTTATAAPPDDKATPAPTKKPAVTKATTSTAESTTAETAKNGAPGFTAIFAIAGLLAVAYAMMRRRE